MIKKLFVATAAVMCVGAGAAWGARKCVKLDAEFGDVSLTGVCELNQPDWSVTETDGTVIHGVGVCSNQDGVRYSVSETITIGVTNDYCWCKMISPAVSKWVLIGYMDPEYLSGGCSGSCGFQCYRYVSGDFGAYYVTDFRRAMFGAIQQ